ncbi:MAG: C10 family peptidase [Muribaculaceae bacterium]|nr:C10 family peptidase [Muribaculaceae bacterium]
MKKTLTLVLLSLLGAGTISAEHLSPTQALARVKGNSQARKVIGNRKATPQLIAELPELYVFSSGDGFMILPADDIALPLLAYADSGEFNPEEIPALKWWLSTYSQQIAYAAATGVSTHADATTPERQPIEPLLKTTWDQGNPYNELCPELYGRKCYTGCVATAMAQVMNYHQWPVQGQGSISYTWKTGNKTESMNFSETSFDWNNMTDNYNSYSTDEQKLAVATLMKACGYSVEMDYSTSASAANQVRIGGALINYFDYDQAIWKAERNFFDSTEWEDLIYADISAGMPVIYGGASEQGGHQFVCDGYSEDGLFHFNWGWGGLSDGYFKLNALNPAAQGTGGFDGGYNLNQHAILGVQKPVEGSKPVYMFGSTEDFKPNNSKVQLGGYAVFYWYLQNIGSLPIPAGTEIDLELIPADGGEPTYIRYTTTPNVPTTAGYSTLSFLIPTSLPEGTYTARPVYKVPGGEWQRVFIPKSNISELTATVKDNYINFVAENAPGFTITDLPENKTIYIGTTFSLSMTLTNKTDTEYLGSMFPRIIKSGSEKVLAWGSSTNIQLAGSETMPFEYVGELTADASATLEPGEYLLYFYSQQSNQAINDPIPVILAERPAKTTIEVTDFKFDGIQPGDIAKFSWTITCTEGYYDDSMTLYILDSADKIQTYRSVSPYLNAGESKQCTIEVPLSDRDFGYYSGALYYDNRMQYKTPFSYLEHTTTIEELTPESADSAIYDLQGRKISNPARGHIYIRAGKLIRL